MTRIGAGAFPVVPGKSDRVRNFESELAPHREEWDRLCREAGDYEFYTVSLQTGPQGDTAIYAFGLNHPAKARLQFGDSAHDRWWVEYFEDVHGIRLDDLTPEQISAGRPQQVFSWTKE